MLTSTFHCATTDALTPAFRHELRSLLNEAFEGDFSDDDWNHATGGVHVWVSDASRVISHGSLVARTLVCSGQILQVGYVEAVATAPTQRRRGHGTAVLTRIGDLIRHHYRLGALSTGTRAFYEPLGWERWHGPTLVEGPRGRERTPDDDGSIMILRTVRSPSLDLEAEIVCDWRPGDVW